MTVPGHRTFLLAALFFAVPLVAQQPPAADDRIRQLESRMDDLSRQMTEIRQEIDKLKGQQPAAPAAAEDLTKIDVTPAAQQPQPALTDVTTINNPQNPGASKVFNPDTSVIGNFLGKAGQRNPFEFGADDIRQPMNLDEAEVAFQAFVDPYLKGNFFLSVTKEGIDVEEGYAQAVALPFDLTAKAGKFKAMFGKDNTWHAHVRPWVDQPLVIHNFFGDEGFNDDGISVSKTISNPWNAFIEATGEAFNGRVENVFDRGSLNDLVYNGHLKFFRDISENANVELGTSYARGTLNDAHNQFGGVDVTYRWKPLQQGLYRSFIARLEAISDRRGDVDQRLKGFYASADYQLAQRWFTGLRVDSADRFTDTGIPNDRGLSYTLTFWPSEFSQVRGQLRRTRYGDVGKSVNELLLQLQFAIGAHGAHVF
jgi:hypothetical protein